MKIAAGWYPDPKDGNRDRYWDGAAWAPGENTVRGERPEPAVAAPASARVPPASASLIAWGIVCVAAGLVIQAAGERMAVRAALAAGFFDEVSSSGEAVAVLGLLVMLVGLVMLVTGVYRMASGIDHLVRISAARDE